MAAISSSDIIIYPSFNDVNTSSGGGRINKALAKATNTPGNFMPDPTPAMIAAGFQQLYKRFISFQNSEDRPSNSTRVYLKSVTPAGDRMYFFAGTQRDVQSGLSGSEDRFGTGVLTSGVSASATEIDVTVEDPSVIIFRDTELIVIDDGSNQQFVAIDGTPTIDGSVVTITLAEALLYNFAINTPVASVYEAGDIAPSVDNKSITTAGSGTLDLDDVVPHSIGSCEAEITITFTSSTAFTCSALIGSADDPIDLGTGNISSSFAPNHPDLGEAMFTIPSAAWGGTWASSDTAEFDLHPAAVPIWGDRNADADVASSDTNTVSLMVTGYSGAAPA